MKQSSNKKIAHSWDSAIDAKHFLSIPRSFANAIYFSSFDFDTSFWGDMSGKKQRNPLELNYGNPINPKRLTGQTNSVQKYVCTFDQRSI